MVQTDGSLEFQTAASRVYRELREDITSGRLPPGTRLVRRKLGERLKVSAIPVTEAIFRLEQDGLVESEPMFGARVRPLTVENARNDHVLREALECQAARMAAEYAAPRELDELSDRARDLDALMADASADPDTLSDRHRDFHLFVARIAGADGLLALLKRVWFRRLMLHNTLHATRYPTPPDWHRALAKAITTGDPQEAEDTMREHVRYNVKKQLEALKKEGNQE